MNLIYFCPDQMRADAIGCYGHPVAKTPNIDRLAAGGVRFDQCHVQHTVCTPSRCSFMSGWYPHVRGHRTLWYPLQKDEPNTLKYLKQAGYEVHWMGKNDLLAQDAFDDSVTHLYNVPGGAEGAREIHAPDDPAYWSFLYGPSPGHNRSWHLVERAIAFLKARKPSDPPFMLYLPIGCPHPPFTCPQPWYDMIDPATLPPLRPAELAGKPAFHALIRQYRQLDQLDEQKLRKVCAVYLGMVMYVDHMLGRLLDAVEETGRDKDTSLFFFSDHGEWAGDYGLTEKWPSALDDCLTHIPMIVKTPDCVPGHVVEAPTACFDIMPTTLELAGVACAHTHFAQSMLPQLAGATGAADRHIFAEGGYDPHEPQCFEGAPGTNLAADKTNIYYPKGRQQQERPEGSVRAVMIRNRAHKLIYRPGDVSELYDLQSDPRELNNRHGDPALAAVESDLKQRLLDWYVHTSDVVPFTPQERDFSEAVKRRFGAE